MVNKDHLLTRVKQLVRLNSSCPHGAHAAARKANQKYLFLHHLSAGFHSSFLHQAACGSTEFFGQQGALPVLGLCVGTSAENVPRGRAIP